MRNRRLRRGVVLGILVLGALPAWAQAPKGSAAVHRTVTVEQPDAERTRQELSSLLDRYPPSLRSALSIDPSLLSNDSYLATYPALAGFLESHPEVARNASFYVGFGGPRNPPDSMQLWRELLDGVAIFGGFGMAIGVVVWLIRTIVDYRRWSRLAKVQTDAHTKILDRFTANEDLLAYIQSPAGSKFLESSPIKLDAGPRGMGAPLGRILWSLQGGLVLFSGGVGMQVVSGRLSNESAQALKVLGVLAVALGLGLVISAVISYVISQRLGLIEPPPSGQRLESLPKE